MWNKISSGRIESEKLDLTFSNTVYKLFDMSQKYHVKEGGSIWNHVFVSMSNYQKMNSLATQTSKNMDSIIGENKETWFQIKPPWLFIVQVLWEG